MVEAALVTLCRSQSHRAPPVATWLWATGTGSVIALCDSCNLEWLANAIRAVDLTPAWIAQIPPTVDTDPV